MADFVNDHFAYQRGVARRCVDARGENDPTAGIGLASARGVKWRPSNVRPSAARQPVPHALGIMDVPVIERGDDHPMLANCWQLVGGSSVKAQECRAYQCQLDHGA